MDKFLPKYKILIIVAILFLALVLRVWAINKIPAGLQIDEGLILYHAQTIAATGLSQFNNQFPVHFIGFGWGENALLIYLLVPLVKLFGLGHVWLFRLVIVLINLLIIGLAYLLSKELFTEKIALVAIFLLAISPWDLTLARLLFNVSLLPLFLLGGLYFLLKGLKTGATWFFILAAIFYSLSLYCYALSFLWLPIMLLLMAVVYKDKVRQLKLSQVLAFGVTFIVLSFPITLFYLKNQLGIFSSIANLGWLALPQLAQTRLDNISIFTLPIFLIPVIFIKNYLLHLAPTFLFVSSNSFIFSKFFGLLYLWQAPLLFIGVLIAIKNWSQANYKFILLWLLAAAIPSALTRENIPHPLRFISALPVLEILCALGLSYVWSSFFQAKYKKYLLALVVFVVANAGLFFYNFCWLYPQSSWRQFQGLDQPLTTYINQQVGQFDKIVVLAPRYVPVLALSPYNYLLYSQTKPDDFSLISKQIAEHQFSLGKVYFLENEYVYFGAKKYSRFGQGVILKAAYQPEMKETANILYIVPMAEEFAAPEFLADKKVVQEFKDQQGQTWFVAAVSATANPE